MNSISLCRNEAWRSLVFTPSYKLSEGWVLTEIWQDASSFQLWASGSQPEMMLSLGYLAMSREAAKHLQHPTQIIILPNCQYMKSWEKTYSTSTLLQVHCVYDLSRTLVQMQNLIQQILGGPEILRIKQSPRWCWCCRSWSEDHSLSSKAVVLCLESGAGSFMSSEPKVIFGCYFEQLRCSLIPEAIMNSLFNYFI